MESTSASPLPTDQNDAPKKKTKDKKGQDAPLPLIAAFCSDPKISPSAFFRVLKSEKVKRFKKDDGDKALELLVTGTPLGAV